VWQGDSWDARGPTVQFGFTPLSPLSLLPHPFRLALFSGLLKKPAEISSTFDTFTYTER